MFRRRKKIEEELAKVIEEKCGTCIYHGTEQSMITCKYCMDFDFMNHKTKDVLEQAIERSKKLFNEGRVLIINGDDNNLLKIFTVEEEQVPEMIRYYFKIHKRVFGEAGILCESCKFRGKSVHYLQQCNYCFNDGYRRFEME